MLPDAYRPGASYISRYVSAATHAVDLDGIRCVISIPDPARLE